MHNYSVSIPDNPNSKDAASDPIFHKHLCYRKIYRIEDAIEIEEMHFKEDREREEREEEGSKQSPEDLEKLTWEYVNFMSLNEEKDKVLKYYEDEKEKL